MSLEITIDGRAIGDGHPPYFIAELSANHNGDLDRAFAIMEAAKDAGADAVKLQTYTADTMTIDHDGPGFVIEGGLWDGSKLYDLYQEAYTPWEWHEALFAKGKELGITVFSSPFDATAVDFLEGLNAPAYKIASFEITDLPLIEKAATTGKPLIISTGMANQEEIGEAVEAARKTGSGEIALLHCTSAYPASPADSNLCTIPMLADDMNVVAGLSDHTSGTAAAVAAVALGAAIVEKHFTLSRDDGGPDAAFSLEPDELAQLCEDCRTAFHALGTGGYQKVESEQPMTLLRRSLYVVEDIAEGESLTAKNVRSIRPSLGLAPKHYPEVLGRRAKKTISRGTPLDWALLTPSADSET